MVKGFSSLVRFDSVCPRALHSSTCGDIRFKWSRIFVFHCCVEVCLCYVLLSKGIVGPLLVVWSLYLHFFRVLDVVVNASCLLLPVSICFR